MTSASQQVATAAHVACCFDTVIAAFEKDGKYGSTLKAAYNAEIKTSSKYPLFVTWKKHNGDGRSYRLRGCIGTFSALPLVEGLQEYAIISAFQDRRFCPLKASEVPFLECGVSVLHSFEETDDIYDWTVGTHGITLKFVCPVKGKTYSATYLPEVAEEQGWDHEETIKELVAKAGYNATITSDLEDNMKVTRYQSSKASLTWPEYLALRSSGGALNATLRSLLEVARIPIPVQYNATIKPAAAVHAN